MRLPATLAVHAGQYHDPITGAVGTPVFQTTTFRFTEEAYAAIAGQTARQVPLYTRYGNPSQWAVQEKLAALEGAESALVFSSGMAAISSTLLALASPGGHIVSAQDVYGGTFTLLNELHRYGLSVSWADPADPASVEAAIRPGTRVLFFESLSNPLLKLAALPQLAAIARRHGLLLVIDNTFLSPFSLRPLELGADVVVHSASKYLNGHSDVIAGAAAGPKALMDQVWRELIRLGGSLDPHACFLLERGMKTLAVRMRTHNAQALALAAWLETQPQVRRVFYPGLPSHPQHALAADLLPGGAGGVVAFELAGGKEAALRLLDLVQIPQPATSLGGVESLISLPFNTSHAPLPPEAQEAVGIRPGLVRLSVGIEALEDLQADLAQALQGLPEAAGAVSLRG
ncbi:MAG: aminotransferase class I/II-fold pyridoxal phosphate-dependent enzyme [Bacteroidia bacterium]|nr:aminotransferase class I/II-fold pyridoxal phosphate-dependent enzyme [Bacteroidia bacterium]